jgi:hypothetical protein
MNLFDIYFSPVNYFTKLKEKPKWLVPLIILVVCAIIITIIVLARFNPQDRISQLREQNLTPEQIERAEKMMHGPFPIISGILASIIFTPLILLLIAVIFNFLLPLLGASGPFLMTFSVFVGAALVRIPGMIIKIILILIKGTPFVQTSFVLFFPMISKNTFLFRLMSKLDFFTIWEMILAAFGLQIVYSFKGKKIYYLVLGLWLVFVLITSIFGFRGGPR